MKVFIEARAVTLDDRHVIGRGGEAVVYRHKDRAVKIYHQLPPADLQARSAKLADFPSNLPREVMGPTGLVTDARRRGNVIGFTMDLVHGGEDLKRLSQRTFREGVLGNDDVCAIFARLHATLLALHRDGVVVGDLNDANVLFVGREPWIIDADSMQFSGHRCVVAHERFLDPRLYGVDFAQADAFTPESDWYAFSTLLFSSLLYVHPFGGVHPTINTLTRRAAARHSVLRPDVKLPKVAASWRILPDELLKWFRAVFDRGLRDAFPRRLLDVTWTRCSSCGVEHGRLACPDCASKSVVVCRPPTLQRGRCRSRVILKTPGRVLAAAVHGTLKVLHEDRGVVRRENGDRVCEHTPDALTRFAIRGNATWIARGDRLLQMKHGAVVAKYNVGQLGNEPQFDTTSSHVFHVEGPWLMDTLAGTRVGPILPGQTWFRCSDHLGYGFYRAGELTQHFLFRPGRAGIRDIDLPPMEGRLTEIDAVFDERHALITWTTERRGAAVTHVHLVDRAGARIASMSGPSSSSAALAPSVSKVIVAGRVLAATDEGLTSLAVDRATRCLVTDRVFVDTAPFVGAGTPILPGPGGSIHVINPREITQLSLC